MTFFIGTSVGLIVQSIQCVSLAKNTENVASSVDPVVQELENLSKVLLQIRCDSSKLSINLDDGILKKSLVESFEKLKEQCSESLEIVCQKRQDILAKIYKL